MSEREKLIGTGEITLKNLLFATPLFCNENQIESQMDEFQRNFAVFKNKKDATLTYDENGDTIYSVRTFVKGVTDMLEEKLQEVYGASYLDLHNNITRYVFQTTNKKCLILADKRLSISDNDLKEIKAFGAKSTTAFIRVPEIIVRRDQDDMTKIKSIFNVDLCHVFFPK